LKIQGVYNGVIHITLFRQQAIKFAGKDECVMVRDWPVEAILVCAVEGCSNIMDGTKIWSSATDDEKDALRKQGFDLVRSLNGDGRNYVPVICPTCVASGKTVATVTVLPPHHQRKSPVANDGNPDYGPTDRQAVRA
jgi:hypothetical protein